MGGFNGNNSFGLFSGECTVCCGGGGGCSQIIVEGAGLGSSIRCAASNSSSGAYASVFGKLNINTASNYSVISGGTGNCILNFTHNTIAGGSTNRICVNNFNTIGGGTLNTVCGLSHAIGGGAGNLIDGVNYSVIGGGFNNQNNAGQSVLVGGECNRIFGGNRNFLGGGVCNCLSSTSANYSFIGGGCFNNSCSTLSFIGGGALNCVSSDANNSIIAGGCCNNTKSSFSTLIGGFKNLNQGQYAYIGNGICNVLCNSALGCSSLGGVMINGVGGNTTDGTFDYPSCSFTVAPTTIYNAGRYSFIGSGFQNVVRDTDYATVLNGFCNYTNSCFSVTLNGFCNINICSCFGIIQGNNNCLYYGCQSTILNGLANCIVNNSQSTILNGFNNCLKSNGASNNLITGGNSNIVCGSINTITASSYSTISGGYNNFLTGFANAIGAFSNSGIINGCRNINNGNFSVISGGAYNLNSSNCNFISGGCCNLTSNANSTISNGILNIGSGCFSFIANGCCNTSSGSFTNIVNGFKNLNQGQYSFIGNGICNQLCNSVSGCCALGSFIGGGVGNGTVGGTWDLATCSFTVAPTICNIGQFNFIGGGFQNVIKTTNYSAIGGGFCNYVDNSFSGVFVGKCNTISGDYSGIISGLCNIICVGAAGFIGSGICNTLSNLYSYSAIVSGCRNVSQGQYGYIGAGSCNKIDNNGFSAVIGGGDYNCATCIYTSILGGCGAKAYLYGQQANANAVFSVIGDNQNSKLIASGLPTINASATSNLTLDGTGNTNPINIPNNRIWSVNAAWLIVVKTLGTATTLVVGASHTGNTQFLTKNIGGVQSISSLTNVSSKNDTGMSSSGVDFTASGGQLNVIFTAPTSGGIGTTYYVNAVITITEIAI
jgi:hypothetical protein